MIVVISCGAKKRPGRHRASDLYVGTYFRAALAWAESVTQRRDIFILSAKYGLVRADDMIDSYDLTLGQPGSITNSAVRLQGSALGLLNRSDVIIVGGIRYVEMGRIVWPNARAPFGRDGGLLNPAAIGKQVKALNAWHGRVP